MPATLPSRAALSTEIVTRVVFAGTGVAAQERDRSFPPTAWDSPTTVIYDLTPVEPKVGWLNELLSPVMVQLKGGVFGNVRLIVTSPDEGVRGFVSWLATQNQVGMYVAPSPESLDSAEPVGPPLTAAEGETLDLLSKAGRWTSASGFARIAGIEPTAATNRLVNLHRKGYLYRFSRSRAEGDVFADPRVPSPAMVAEAMLRGSAKVSPPAEVQRTARLLIRALESETEESPTSY